jgi:hypothetical protein
MSKWVICKGRNKLCGDCKHARKHIRESDCEYLIVCKDRKPTFEWFTLTKCEDTTPPEKKNK